MRTGSCAVLALLVSACFTARIPAAKPAAPVVGDELAGTWVARLSHAGESSEVVLRLDTVSTELLAYWSTPAIDVWDLPLGAARVEGKQLHVGPFALTYDRTALTLSGVVPEALVPVYTLQAVFRRSAPVKRVRRLQPDAPVAEPLWVFDAGAPLWADLTFSRGAVLAGADDGRLHAIDARTGRALWTFRAGGAIRARPTIAGEEVLVHADDGVLYALEASSGKERWRAALEARAWTRPQLGDESSRYEFRASAVTARDGRLYAGTHDGRVVALRSGGARLWEFRAGDSVTATPLVTADRVYFGSFDGNVYALDVHTGALVWKQPTGGPVTSAPAWWGDLVIAGSRSYDLFGFEGTTGKVVWKTYYWYSWVESPAAVFGDSVYTGSSDAAKVFALDAATGRRLWDVDAGGSAWGQPAVTETRVFAGAAGVLHYLVPHRATALALDRATGRPVWRHPVPPPAAESAGAAYGFAGAPALGNGLVYFPCIDGRVYAFRQ